MRPGHHIVVHHLRRQQVPGYLPRVDHVRSAGVGVHEALVPGAGTIRRATSNSVLVNQQIKYCAQSSARSRTEKSYYTLVTIVFLL